MRQQVGLVDDHEIGGAEHVRVLQRLVITLRHRDDDDLGLLPDVEERRAHEVPHVLDEQQRALARRQSLDRLLHHRGVEVTAGSGVDLDGACPGVLDPLCVEQRLLVSLDDADLPAALELGDGALEKRGLARAR